MTDAVAEPLPPIYCTGGCDVCRDYARELGVSLIVPSPTQHSKRRAAMKFPDVSKLGEVTIGRRHYSVLLAANDTPLMSEPLTALRKRHADWAAAEFDGTEEHPDTQCSADRDRAHLLAIVEAARARD